jgi:1,4-dihydroxy-2-naphthoate octaprenyltransferase
MGNLDITQRNQLERSTLSGSDSLRRGSEKGAAIYSVVALLIGVALCVVAVTTIENWTQWLVLGVIVVTMVGFMVALSPSRRGVEQH